MISISFDFLDLKFRCQPCPSGARAVELDFYLMEHVLTSYEDVLREIGTHIVEIEGLEDEDGVFYYSSLVEEDQLRCLQSYLSTPTLIRIWVNKYLEASGLDNEIREQVEKRFEVMYSDSCECPVCQPDSRGKFLSPTQENRDEYGCLLAGIGVRAKRICHYLTFVEDVLSAPYYLFEAYQIKALEEAKVLSDAARKRKVEEKARMNKEAQRKAEEKRGFRPRRRRTIQR